MTTKQFITASRFLQILDPSATKFTFQIFDDRKPKRKNLSQVLSGSLSALWPRLKALNKIGAGVHVTVQESDLFGRKQYNIKNIRAVFADNDNTINIKKLPLKPSLIVESSPNKSHLYYLLDKKLSTSNGHKPEFDGIMRSLIEFGSDPCAKDLSHTLRMPGFLNWKYDKPYETKIKHVETNFLDDPVRYSWDSLINTFEPTLDVSCKDLNAFFEDTPEIIRAPYPAALIAAALDCVDPDCDYNTWRDIGMALHYASNGGPLGYDSFFTWSSMGAKHTDYDWPNQWDYFSNTSKENLIKLGTLFHIAKTQYEWNGGYNANLDDIRNLIRIEQNSNFEYINQYWGLIPIKKEMLVIYQGKNSLRYWGHNFYSQKAAKTYFATQKIPSLKSTKNGDSIIKIPVFEKWLEWGKRNIYEGLVFEPSAGIRLGDNPKLLKHGNRYNTYLGLSNEGQEGDWKCISDHIFEVWCKKNQERYEYVMNWLARMYQLPGKPAETMIVLTSRPGAGKNIILDGLVNSFGRYGKTDKAGEDLTADFNAILMDAVFILVGEASFDSSKKQGAIINTLATQERISATKKHEDTIEIKNCVHVICLSNEERPLKVQAGDRRIYVMSCDPRYVNNFKYFKDLAAKMEDGAMDAFIHYLRHRDISGFQPQVMPESEKGLKSSMVEDDARKITSFVRTALEEQNFLFPLEPSDGIQSIVSCQRIYSAYETYCTDNRNGGRLNIATSIGLGRKLNEIFGDLIRKKRSPTKDEDGKRPTIYEFKAIDSLRSAFDSFIGAPNDWGEDDDEEFDFLN